MCEYILLSNRATWHADSYWLFEAYVAKQCCNKIVSLYSWLFYFMALKCCLLVPISAQTTWADGVAHLCHQPSLIVDRPAFSLSLHCRHRLFVQQDILCLTPPVVSVSNSPEKKDIRIVLWILFSIEQLETPNYVRQEYGFDRVLEKTAYCRK
jgi:hypothetical protein